MAKRERITRKVFGEGFPKIREFYLEEARLCREDLNERDELYCFWSEIPDGGNRPRVLWNNRPVEKYVCTLAILRTASRKKSAAQKLCMAFNGERQCHNKACTYVHKCLGCSKDFSENYLGNSHCTHCSFWKERERFIQRFGRDPFDPSQPGLEKDDENFPAALRRLAAEPKKSRDAETASAASASSRASHASRAMSFAALASEASDLSMDETGTAAAKQAEAAEQAGPQAAEAAAEDAEVETKADAEDAAAEAEELTEQAQAAEVPAASPDAGQNYSSKHTPRSKPKLGKAGEAHVLGFVCHIDRSHESLAAVHESLINHEEKKVNIQELAAEILGKDWSELKLFYSAGPRLSVVTPRHSPQGPNKLATRFLHALDVHARQTLLYGTVCFVATPSGSESMSTRFRPSWDVYEELVGEDSLRFEQWYDQLPSVKKYRLVDRQGQPGDMLFIPVDPAKPVDWIAGDCSSYEEIRQKARRLFEKKGSCSRAVTCCESSDEELSGRPENRAFEGVVDIFKQQQLLYSFVKGESKLASLTCSPEIMMPEKRVRLNERAAQIVGKLYGVSILQKHYMKRLRGDAILCMVNKERLLEPRCVWAPELGDFERFLEQLQEEAAEDEGVVAHVRLQGMKLWSQAWLDYGNQYSKSISELEEMAQPEDWMNRLVEDGEEAESGLPYLESYMQFKFAFSLHQSHQTKEEKGIGFRKGNQILIFATGLLRRKDLQHICGVYDCGAPRGVGFEPPPYDRRYRFREWTVAPEDTAKLVEPLDLLTDECMQEGAERNHLKLHELKSFDPYAILEMPEKCLKHIAEKVDRFEADNQSQSFKAPSGWDLEDDERRMNQVKRQLEKVRAWCRTDRSIPIMTVFGDFTYQWLVPLPNPSQEDGKLSENPTLVAVLQHIRKDANDENDHCYILKAVLTLDMALMQARLCGKLHQRWTVSQRQAVELQKVVAAVKQIPIPEGNADVKKAVQHAIKCLHTYKDCIRRVLPTVASVEDCEASRWRSPKHSGLRPRKADASSGARAPASGASEDEDRWEELGARRDAAWKSADGQGEDPPPGKGLK